MLRKSSPRLRSVACLTFACLATICVASVSRACRPAVLNLSEESTGDDIRAVWRSVASSNDPGSLSLVVKHSGRFILNPKHDPDTYDAFLHLWCRGLHRLVEVDKRLAASVFVSEVLTRRFDGDVAEILWDIHDSIRPEVRSVLAELRLSGAIDQAAFDFVTQRY